MSIHTKILILILCLIFAIFLDSSVAFEFTWEIDETPEGQESATVVQPVQVIILDQPVTVADNSSAISLMKHYSVIVESWTHAHASRLLKTFESIPHHHNSLRADTPYLPASVWTLTDRHIHNDIVIEHHGETRLVTIAADAFTHATPLIAEIDGVRGRYFSRRLHRAVLRYITENGTDHNAIRQILRERYDVSIDIPDYTELTKQTTAEHAGRFAEFKPEELIVLLNMLEEYPQGMITTSGLKYLVRRLDGTPHPTHPTAAAVAWTGSGYIEFMESAFTSPYEHTQRLVLHEKAHFLWQHLFGETLKQDWIKLGGWYENADDRDGWSTTKQTEFVSAYAHAKNPDEDMAESISFYIVRPDLLRSRSPAKHEFIQNRIMHGTRYISQIREDLTFEVYNLYPDYVYPGRIIRVNIDVEGQPEEDKLVTVELEIHGENELDAAQTAYIRIYSEKGTYFDIRTYPIDAAGTRIGSGHVLRGQITLSKYTPAGYWTPESISVSDAQGNKRHQGQNGFGWKLYINNPLADCEPPQYVANSARLALSEAVNHKGEAYLVVTATWQVIEPSGLERLFGSLNDTFLDTYSLSNHGTYDSATQTARIDFEFPHYMPTGIYALNRIYMKDNARNSTDIFITNADIDEEPQTIMIATKNPDLTKPTLDANRIKINATPTNPDSPNGETIVNITFHVKDDNSGYNLGSMHLRDPQGILHHYYHYPESRRHMYHPGDSTIYAQEQQIIVLPIGSPPGTWGLSNMYVEDKAGNRIDYDFTEIVRFVVDDTPVTFKKEDLNKDGVVNVLDLVIVANEFGTDNANADVNKDGIVNILDLVAIANQIS